MTMEQQLRQLEARVDELLRISAHLRQENRLLRERETRLLDAPPQLGTTTARPTPPGEATNPRRHPREQDDA